MSKIEKELVNKDEFTLGERMKLARIGIGLSVEQTAVLMGIKKSSYYGKENGQDLVTPRNIAKFEDAVGITQATLLEDSCSLDLGRQPDSQQIAYPNNHHKRKPGSSRIEKHIEEIIRQRISNGTYSGMLPIQKELAGEFGYSRVTIDKALQPLREEGILLGKSKRGTIIVELGSRQSEPAR